MLLYSQHAARPILHANTDVMQTMPVVLNSAWPKCQSKTPKYVTSKYNKQNNKTMLKKGPETEKKFA